MATSVTLTFLFTDIEGSTARWEEQRAAMALALERHDALLRLAIEGWGGQVFKTVGDAFCTAFGDAEAALNAAIAAQRALAAEDWQHFGSNFGQLRVRMGIHHGKAEARRGDYFGPALNRTAHLTAACLGGQILLSLAAQQVVRDYLPAGVSLRDLGYLRLKALRHGEQVFQVVAPGLVDIRSQLAATPALAAHERLQVQEGATARALPEAIGAILAAIRGDAGGAAAVTLSPEQARELALSRPSDLTAYRLGRIAEWSQPGHRLDERFVSLSLWLDRGEEASGARWAAGDERHGDLGKLLEALPDPALVVLGPPGAGKSTLLRRLELDIAVAGLRAEQTADRLSFLIQLNQYKPKRPGDRLPAPGEWLADEWAERYPALPALDSLLAQGRMVLLLDALNEIPAASETGFRATLGLWKDWLLRLVQTRPGNRVVFSCRALDYSAPLSTPALRVPQVQIEALSDTQISAFLQAYSPLRGDAIRASFGDSGQLDALRIPYFLALVVEQIESTGELGRDRAGILTGFVRQALRREVERDNPLFAQDALLTSRDLRRLTQWQWRDPYELPERGELFPKLAQLAFGMQAAAADGGASQLRLGLDQALALLASEQGESILQAGLALAVLDEDQAAEELLFHHQLLQEYFAARALARAPQPTLAAAVWRAADLRPSLSEQLTELGPAEALPALPQTGWEESMLLAGSMTADREAFVRALAPQNLTLAARVAAEPRARPGLSTALLDELRWGLVARSRDPEADLRARIAAGLALGDLGDPRYEAREGPHGRYLMPPWIEVAGGTFTIGEDEAIAYDDRGTSSTTSAHVPAHRLQLGPFRLARFPVTNAEWACFMAAGAYDQDIWWQSADARLWRQGLLSNQAGKANNRFWRRRFLAEAGLFERMAAEGGFASSSVVACWRDWLALDQDAFEQAIELHFRPQRQNAPRYWQDPPLRAAGQPVVGLSWYEARAYCAWLSAQSGLAIRLPSEVEWEAAMRGPEARPYPWGSSFVALQANTFEGRLRRSSPVGVFPASDSPSGLADGAGNVLEWTTSLWGDMEDLNSSSPPFAYPYDAGDGREDASAPPSVARILRGGSWSSDQHGARCSARLGEFPDARYANIGFRLLAQ